MIGNGDVMDERQRFERIEELLAAYGADTDRWPAGEREVLDGLEPAERARLLAPEQALDRLIANAREMAAAGAPRDDLISAIMERAADSGARETNAPDGNVVNMSRRAIGSTTPAHQPSRRDWTAAAALLAASLVLGLLVGSSERMQSTVLGIGDLAGITTSAPATQLSALDEVFLQPEEDIL